MNQDLQPERQGGPAERVYGKAGEEEPQDLASEWAMRRGFAGCGLVALLLLAMMTISMCAGPTRARPF